MEIGSEYIAVTGFSALSKSSIINDFKWLITLFEIDFSLAQLAKLAQRAENDFVGMPCGIMDQSVSLMAQAGNALLLDCRDLSTEQIPLDLDFTLTEKYILDKRAEQLQNSTILSGSYLISTGGTGSTWATMSTNLGNPSFTINVDQCPITIVSKKKPNFVNYQFKEDMIGDGIENCLQYCENFDPKKSNNPFSYFTQIIYYAFLRRIQKEKKQNYIKYKYLESLDIKGDFKDMLKALGITEDERDSLNNFGHKMKKPKQPLCS